MVEGNARLEYVNKGKTLVLNPSLDQACQVLCVAGKTPGYETAVSGYGQG